MSIITMAANTLSVLLPSSLVNAVRTSLAVFLCVLVSEVPAVVAECCPEIPGTVLRCPNKDV